MKIKKGDKIRVITGKHKNVEGQIIEINLKKQMVMLDEIKMKKHQKAKQGEETGKIMEVPKPLPISNVMLLDPKASAGATRIGYKIEKGKKVRFSKKSGRVYPD